MSSFKEKLAQLFENSYGNDTQLLNNSTYFNLKPKLQHSKQNSVTFSPSNYICDNTVISPYYTEKPSFYFKSSTHPSETQRHLRQNSANKYHQRIKKEIHLLSDTFKAGINPQGKMNYLMTSNNNYGRNSTNDFSINYLTTYGDYVNDKKDKANNNKTNITTKFIY